MPLSCLALLGFISLLQLFIHCVSRNDIKRDGAGRGNWGTPSDEIAL